MLQKVLDVRGGSFQRQEVKVSFASVKKHVRDHVYGKMNWFHKMMTLSKTFVARRTGTTTLDESRQHQARGWSDQGQGGKRKALQRKSGSEINDLAAPVHFRPLPWSPPSPGKFLATPDRENNYESRPRDRSNEPVTTATRYYRSTIRIAWIISCRAQWSSWHCAWRRIFQNLVPRVIWQMNSREAS